ENPDRGPPTLFEKCSPWQTSLLAPNTRSPTRGLRTSAPRGFSFANQHEESHTFTFVVSLPTSLPLNWHERAPEGRCAATHICWSPGGGCAATQAPQVCWTRARRCAAGA